LTLNELVSQYSTQNLEKGQAVKRWYDLLMYVSPHFLDKYIPADRQRFNDRLERWSSNFVSEQQRVDMLLSLQRFLFIGELELNVLFKSAYSVQVTQWLTEQGGLDLFSDSAPQELASLLESTRFFPATDSLDINYFCKINHVGWNFEVSALKLIVKDIAAREAVRQQIEREQVRRIVVVEDIVCGGTTVLNILKELDKLNTGAKILFVPLICGRDGYNLLRIETKEQRNITISPAFLLPADTFTGDFKGKHTFAPLNTLETVAKSSWKQIKPHVSDRETEKGFNNMGGLLAHYRNCPNNTYPLFHVRTDNWHPLFERVGRHGR
jgi:hypothetical protein